MPIQYTPKPLADFLKFYAPQTPSQETIQSFQAQIAKLLEESQKGTDEEFQKNEINKFLSAVYGYNCNTKGSVDSAIYVDGEAQVLLEVKSLANTSEFPRSSTHLTSKALCESILYFLRECGKNSIKHIIICNPCEFFVFDARNFRKFAEDSYIDKLYKNCDDKQGTDTTTKKFYEDLRSYLEGDCAQELSYAYVSLREPESLVLLYQLLSPQVLLRQHATIDANTLNQGFYEELLYILGLQERTQGGKITIVSSEIPNTLSHTLSKTYATLNAEEVFTLITTWNNRILFLRLLESMLLGFAHIDRAFLDIAIIKDFATLQTLFFEVLAQREKDRTNDIPPFLRQIPYLNSSLFDKTPLEVEGKQIRLLESAPLPLFPRSILKKDSRFKDKGSLPLLEYLFEFLHAYDFTTTPKDISEGMKQNHDKLINSAVLGLVFEKLNGYKEGSFYTPSFITSYMCQESITQAALERFNSTYGWKCQNLEELKRKIAKAEEIADEDLLSTLLTLRICDPSVGSGHFLVSALNEMIQIAHTLGIVYLPRGVKLTIENDEILITTRDGIFAYHKPTSSDEDAHTIQTKIFNLKKSIIQNCLFGVDINPNSCEITKLRLWIELLKYSYYLFDEQGKNTNTLETLPNIDINIKCGNSLISHYPLNSSLTIGQTKEFATNLKQAILNYKMSVGAYKEGIGSKSKIIEQISATKNLIISYLLERSLAKIQLKEYLSAFVSEYGDAVFDIDTEFGLEMFRIIKANKYRFTPTLTSLEPAPMTAEGDKLLTKIKKCYEELENIKTSQSFEWRFEFPEVLDEEGNFLGFDCVIGNPPYIRQEEIKELKPSLQKNFQIYENTSDIYTYFFEQGYKLLSQNAILSFITSNKWTRAGYGENLRAFLLKNTTLQSYMDLNGEKVFENASVDTSITIFIKSTPTPTHQIHFLECKDIAELFRIAPTSIPQNTLSKDAFIFADSSTLALKEKIQSIGTPLKDWGISINYGIKTGYNEAFIITTETREAILQACKTQQEREATSKLIRKVLRGRDIKRYSYEWAGLWIINIHNGYTSTNKTKMPPIDIEQYPTLKAYFNENAKNHKGKGKGFFNRDDKGITPYNLRNCAYLEEFEKEKILYPETTQGAYFVIDRNQMFLEKTAFCICGNNLLFLQALLSSKAITYYFKNFSNGCILGKKGYQYNKHALEKLPIPKITESNKAIADKIIALVEKILKAKENNPTTDTKPLESQIDSLVYTLYNLTEAEIQIIEGKS
ncbi:restriction endonuclease [Helicobacter enhydrae]|uniref:site-specific DNA-methyltransferase (adenine-specific) n=1 Tax=Helicobacter enhydrae TaxID=222136 RepID=A0A1B1U582_9HELI|nr:class I SAM-dependent DNA methyltransferase [Helicobacter enhydrae]ANV97845.1 restriction endonuclease [Helicobacter enhydrae]